MNGGLASYKLEAFSVSDRFDFRSIMERFLEQRTERFNRECVILHLAEDSKVFIFKFGSVVFLNVSREKQRECLKHFEGLTEKGGRFEANSMCTDDLTLKVGAPKVEVSFDAVSITSFEQIGVIQIIALVLARSSALELIEDEVNKLLSASEIMSSALKQDGLARKNRNRLLRLMGQGFSTQHQIMNQLAIFNAPERTWDNKDCDSVYNALVVEFELQERTANVEKMLTLSTSVSSLLLEMANAHKAELLELIIIFLIVFEILQTFFKFH